MPAISDQQFMKQKMPAKESQSEHLPNTASLEASFAAEAVLLSALGGFLLAGKKKERVSLLQDSFCSFLKRRFKNLWWKPRECLILYLEASFDPVN